MPVHQWKKKSDFNQVENFWFTNWCGVGRWGAPFLAIKATEWFIEMYRYRWLLSPSADFFCKTWYLRSFITFLLIFCFWNYTFNIFFIIIIYFFFLPFFSYIKYWINLTIVINSEKEVKSYEAQVMLVMIKKKVMNYCWTPSFKRLALVWVGSTSLDD